QQRLALLGRQLVQRPVQARGLLRTAGVPLRVVRVRQRGGALVGVGRRRRPVLQRAPEVGQSVVGDAVQPGRERRVRAPAVACGHHPLPHVLEQLLGQGAVMQLAQQEAEQRQAVARVQGLERGNVARGPGLHQDLVSGWVHRLLHVRHPSAAGAGRKRHRGGQGQGGGGGACAVVVYNEQTGALGSRNRRGGPLCWRPPLPACSIQDR